MERDESGIAAEEERAEAEVTFVGGGGGGGVGGDVGSEVKEGEVNVVFDPPQGVPGLRRRPRHAGPKELLGISTRAVATHRGFRVWRESGQAVGSPLQPKVVRFTDDFPTLEEIEALAKVARAETSMTSSPVSPKPRSSASDAMLFSEGGGPLDGKGAPVAVVPGKNPRAAPKDLHCLRQEGTAAFQLLVRRGCIIVSFPCVGALIRNGEAHFIVDPEKNASLDAALLKMQGIFATDTSAEGGSGEADSFEYVVLAALFAWLHMDLDSKLQPLKRSTKDKGAVNKLIDKGLEAMGLCSHQVSVHLSDCKELEREIQAAIAAIEGLQANKEDCLNLVLSIDFNQNKEAYEEEAKQLEDLLEWNYSHLRGLLDTTAKCIADDEGNLSSIRLGLDTLANRSTLFQVKIQLVTMGFSFCSMVSGCALYTLFSARGA